MEKRKISTGLAFLPLVSMAILVGVGNIKMGIPLEFLLLLATIIAGLVAYKVGYSYEEMFEAYALKIKKAFPAILILVAIGGVVGTWMFSGTVPMMIYYGLKFLNPQYVMIRAFLVTALISTFTGTSWGSAATSGVAFMGIAQSMGLPLAPVAGAVLGGAVFGDKVSPVSDTTNISAMASEISVYDHIRGMLPNVIGAGIITSIIFIVMGITNTGSLTELTAEANLVLTSLDQMYNFDGFNVILLLIPAAIIFVGGIKGYDPLILMVSSSITAIILGMLLNGFTIVNGATALISGFNLQMLPNEITNMSPQIEALVTRGGFQGMISGAVLFCFLAMPFGAFMEISGALHKIVQTLETFIKGRLSLIFTTFGTAAVLNGVTANGQFTLLTTGDMYGEAFDDKRLPRNVLSRTMENGVTVLESLMPWHVTAIYMAATLGVSTLDYLPWAIFNLSSIGLYFILAIVNFSGTKNLVEKKEIA
jgi:NhaC family Na+:H+ antiporter